MPHPFAAETLLEVLAGHVATRPESTAYIFTPATEPGDLSAETLSYRQLHQRVAAIAAALQSACLPGERALLLYPSGLEYVCAFLGCLAAGVIAVPAYPPSPRRPDERLQAMAADCRPALALTNREIAAERPRYLRQMPLLASIPWLETEQFQGAPAAALPPPPDPQSIAFLQYTSGSTRQPRGVMLRHANLMANHAAFRHALSLEPNLTVCWLPLHHDMGLVGNVLQALYHGGPCVLMPSLAFLQNPLTWLQTISAYRAEVSGAPNFAYELCLRIPTEQRRGLDLSCWRLALTGAEPIHAETLSRFQQAFGPHGFQPGAFFAAYGLAEATVFVAGATLKSAGAVRKLDRHALASGLALPAADTVQEIGLLACGPIGQGMEAQIVRPDTHQPCPAGQVGEIWLRGSSIAAGYWNNPQESAETFQAQIGGAGPAYLRTGDLGFLDQGELVVTGRLKELMIFNGRNYYPIDLLRSLETVALLADSLAQGGGAAFELPAPDGGSIAGGRLGLALEIRKIRLEALSPAGLAELCAEIRACIAGQHQLQVDTIYFVSPGSIPRTSSGKVRQRECCARLLAGELIPLSVHRNAPGPDPAAAQVTAVRDLPAYLRTRLAALLGCEPAQLGEQTRFSELGFNLAHAAQLRQHLQSELELETSPTLAFDYPTLSSLVGYLQARLAPLTQLAAPPQNSAAALEDLSDDELATRLAEKLRQNKLD